MPIDTAQLDRAHERAMRAAFPEVVTELRERLGRPLVTSIGGVKETRAINQWATGERVPGDTTQTRLRLALQLALMIESADGRRVARAWFQGINPQLDDRAPARVLRDGPLDHVGTALLGAARAFLEHPNERIAQNTGPSPDADPWQAVRRQTLLRDTRRPQGELLEEAIRLSRFTVELAAAGRRAKS